MRLSDNPDRGGSVRVTQTQHTKPALNAFAITLGGAESPLDETTGQIRSTFFLRDSLPDIEANDRRLCGIAVQPCQSHKGKVALLDAPVNASDVVRAGRLAEPAARQRGVDDHPSRRSGSSADRPDPGQIADQRLERRVPCADLPK